MELNKEEIVWGAGFGLAFAPWIGWLAIPAAAISALLWAMTGMGYAKLWRRLGCPALMAGCVWVQTGWNPIWYSVVPAWAVLSIGYGIPDSTDKGSALGRFWAARAKSAAAANFATRATIAVLLALSFCPVILLPLRSVAPNGL